MCIRDRDDDDSNRHRVVIGDTVGTVGSPDDSFSTGSHFRRLARSSWSTLLSASAAIVFDDVIAAAKAAADVLSASERTLAMSDTADTCWDTAALRSAIGQRFTRRRKAGAE